MKREKEKNFFEGELAPIILFTYNRLKHTQQTIEALQKNKYAMESHIYIYSDAAKNEEGKEAVYAVRQYLRSITGFNKIEIIERNENWGLAKNIIDGVTKIVNKYGKIIVLEDDIITSENFLMYMNDALEIYQDEKKVMQISGNTYPVDKKDLPETFFTTIGQCWGWATWTDRWAYFKRNPEELVTNYDVNTIRKFVESGVPSVWDQVHTNSEGKLYTWACFFHNTIFQQKGLVLNAKNSLAINIGFDGSGAHCELGNRYHTMLSTTAISFFPTELYVREDVKKAFRNFFYREEAELFQFVQKYKLIICYGAGNDGKYIKKFLQMHNIKIMAFVVSDNQECQTMDDEIPVINLSNLPFSRDYGIILSLSRRFHISIKKELSSRNYFNTYSISDELLSIAKNEVDYFFDE